MNRRAIIIWGIVGLVAIIGIILTYILLRNNGSSDSVNTVSQDTTTQNSNTTIKPFVADDLSQVSASQTSDTVEYSPEYIIPSSLLSRLKINTENSDIKYFYSANTKTAFTYESKSIDKVKDIIVTENGNIIYTYTNEADKNSGQSIEIINIDSDKRFNIIPDIITTQLLTPVQNRDCKVTEKDGKYSVIAKDTKVKDSTAICGKYAKGNNRFFIKPQEEGTATNKLVFVTAGDRELSYDGSNNGKFWYQSVVVE
jgi:hypothetical protein